MIIQDDPTLKRKRQLAEAMTLRSQQPRKIEHVNQGLAQLAQAISGKVQTNRVDKAEADRKEKLAQAISGYSAGNSNAFAAFPEMQSQIAMDDANRKRDIQDKKELFDYEKANTATERKKSKDVNGILRYEDTGDQVFISLVVVKFDFPDFLLSLLVSFCVILKSS